MLILSFLPRAFYLLSILGVLFCGSTFAIAQAPKAKSEKFFEERIRPVLVEKCYSCHSQQAKTSKKLRGSLFLDSATGLLSGGDTGPAIVPGDPGKSLLLQSLKYDSDIKMPPSGKLPDKVIADFETWIQSGAYDPRQVSPNATPIEGLSVEKGRSFWAYQLPKHHVKPLTNAKWPRVPLDHFILAKLEEQQIEPAPEADRTVLIRRLYFDLIGLPPTPADIHAFVNDPRENAYERLVDDLLSRPQFGECWARHWFDIARYAESVTLRGFVFHEAWRYRDYVIECFNEDTPYNRFLKEQIAGDLLPASSWQERQRQLIATNYLTLGNTNFEEQDKKQLRMDVVDEQLDVICKGLMAQTVTCARCHDHKFDPIPTADYYALAGILRNTKTMEHANVSAWTEVPLPMDPESERQLKIHEARVSQIQQELKLLKSRGKQANNKGILTVEKVPGIVVDDRQATKIGTWQESTHSGSYIGQGYLHDQNGDKGKKSLTFVPQLIKDDQYEVWLAYSPGTSRAANVPVTIVSADGEKTIAVNMKLAPTIEGRFISLGTYQFEKSGQSFVIISNEGTEGHVTADCVSFVPHQNRFARGQTEESASLVNLEKELRELLTKGPKRIRVMAPLEEKVIEDCSIHIRGSANNLGNTVSRGFLSVITDPKALNLPSDQSGRKQLADWIASPDNPLTARVFVNRCWHWLFGHGLVRTVDNFGTTGEKPSHPELLDELTLSFIDSGWSVKKLIREIVLSRTYRLSTLPTNDLRVQRDPENRWFGRANRKRLDAECIRDAMLHSSQTIDLKSGGPSFSNDLKADYSYKDWSNRRSIYQPVFRNSMHPFLSHFDIADPSSPTGERNASVVVQQSLYLMNDPFVLSQAELTAKHLIQIASQNEERIQAVFMTVLGRSPHQTELRLVRKSLQSNDTELTNWTRIVQALYAHADFRYLD